MQFPIPFKDLLPIETVKSLSQLVAQPALMSALKDAAQKLGLKDQLPTGNLQQILQQAGRWMESVSEPWLRSSQPGLMPGINATGELFSSRWCTHRLCADVRAQLNHVQSHYAETTKLDLQLKNLLVGLTGAQSVLVVPNLSMALFALASASNSPSNACRFVLPRVDCIRLPQSGTLQGGNIRSVLDQAHVQVSEIGTTQDCTAIDFDEALQVSNAILLLSSPNSTNTDAQEMHRRCAIDSAKRNNAMVVEIAMNGCIHDLSGVGVQSRVLSECWDKAHGADLILLPGDCFLGGPECGILLGTQSALESVQRFIDLAGFQANSSTKAALLRTLQASESLEQWKQLPIGMSLSTSFENLEHRAQRLALQLTACPMIERIAVVSKDCRLGAGVWGGMRIKSSVLQLFPKGMSPSALAEQLAAGELPLWGNVQSDHVEWVMRSIEPDEDRLVVQQLCPSDAPTA